MFGQTSSNTSSPFWGASTGFAPFGGGTSTSQTSTPFRGFGGGTSPFGGSTSTTTQTSTPFGGYKPLGSTSRTTETSTPSGGFVGTSPFGSTKTSTPFGGYMGTSTVSIPLHASTAQKSAPFGGTSTGIATFGVSTAQTSAPFSGLQGTSAKFTPFGGSTPQICGSYLELATTTTQSAPNSTTTLTFGKNIGASSSPFGAQSTTHTIGNTATAGGQGQGSRVAKYKVTVTQDGPETSKFKSITAMQVYANKSFEELRFEDYWLGDKVGRTIATTRTTSNPTVLQTPATPTTPFSIPQPSPNPFNTSITNPWPKLFTSPTPTPATPKELFSVLQPSLNPFNTSINPWPKSFTSPTPTPATPADPFSVPQPSTNPFNTSITNPSPKPFTSPTLAPATPTTPCFFPQPSSTPFINFITSPWTSPSISPTPTPAKPTEPFPVPQPSPNPFNTSTTEPNHSITHTQTPTTSPAPSPFPLPQPQPSNTPFLQQNNLVQQHDAVVVLVPATNPFGTPHATSQTLNSGTIQYGISSIPVVDRPALASVRSSSLTARLLVRRHVGLPSARRYDLYKSKNDTSVPKIPFFSDDADQVPKAPKPKIMF